MAFTRLTQQQQQEEATQKRPDDLLSMLKRNLPPKWSAATIHLSKQIDIIKKMKDGKHKARLAVATQLLDVMLREGAEGYDRFMEEGDYRWAIADSQSEGGKKGKSAAGKGATAKRGKTKPATAPAAKNPNSPALFSLADSDASAAASPLADSDASSAASPAKKGCRQKPSSAKKASSSKKSASSSKKSASKNKKKKSADLLALEDYSAGIALALGEKEKHDDRRSAGFDQPYPGEVPDAFIEFCGHVSQAPMSIYDINGTSQKYEKTQIRNEIFNEPTKMWPISRPPKGASFLHSPTKSYTPPPPCLWSFMCCYPTCPIQM